MAREARGTAVAKFAQQMSESRGVRTCLPGVAERIRVVHERLRTQAVVDPAEVDRVVDELEAIVLAVLGARRAAHLRAMGGERD